MTIRTKYVNGMNEIKADNELKQRIINKSITSAAEPRSVARAFHSKAAMIAVSCMIIFLLAVGGPLVLHNNDQENPATLFSGFVVTAYAADGAQIVVKPDVTFPLGQYAMYMSSVPGFPITIGSKDADKIEVKTSEGELLLWNPADPIVKYQGKETTVKSGDTIYWSPMVEGAPSQSWGTEGILEITAYKDMKKLGSGRIEIKMEDYYMYTGKLTND
ncbi:hypothetical protein [Paenibacillus sp. LPE1-1-1.1]|uniref:hypothetical protein n=1 Tax=Paenibacillus sp. LPE1-1-1.1 TaxID=3135230 RepID=UPI003421D468